MVYEVNDDEIIIYVIALWLKQNWSPGIISAKLLEHCPDDPRMHLRPEALYQWIYNNAKDDGTWLNTFGVDATHAIHTGVIVIYVSPLPGRESLATHTGRKNRLLTLIHLGNVARMNRSIAYCGVTSPRERVVRYRIGH